MEDINTLTQKANSGDAVAMRKLGYEYLIGKNIQKDEKKAFHLFRAAVWEGDLNATIYCGYCCKTGAGLEKPNIVAAARYYEYGARAGVAAAQYELARIYIDKEMGDACFIGGANPYIGCERWLKKAAEQNYIYAEELLADKYYEGVYIVKDVKAAIYWYEKSSKPRQRLRYVSGRIHLLLRTNRLQQSWSVVLTRRRKGRQRCRRSFAQ